MDSCCLYVNFIITGHHATTCVIEVYPGGPVSSTLTWIIPPYALYGVKYIDPVSVDVFPGPDTSCVKQGIDEVPAQYCGEACAIYKFKVTTPSGHM